MGYVRGKKWSTCYTVTFHTTGGERIILGSKSEMPTRDSGLHSMRRRES